MSEFMAFIALVGRIITFLLKLAIDVICLALLLASFAAPWRIPWILMSLGDISSREDFWGCGCINFGCALMDWITIPLGFASLGAFWRWPTFLPLMCSTSAWSNVESKIYYGAEARLLMAANFFIMLLDLFTLPFLVLACLSPFRWSDLFEAFSNHFTAEEDTEFDMHLRASLIKLGLWALVDAFFLPCFIVAIISWRHSEARAALKEEGMEMRYAVISVFVNVLIDVPFIALGVLVMSLVWRCTALIDELKSSASTFEEARKVVWTQFLLTLRDLPFVAMFVIVVCTLWRAYQVIRRVVSIFVRPTLANTEPKLTVQEARVEFPDRGGAILHLRCRKPDPQYVLSEGANLQMYVVDGGQFWASCEDTLGSTATLLVQNMLPLNPIPQYLSTSAFYDSQGEEDVTLVLDFKVGVKQSTLYKKLRRMSNAGFVLLLQLEPENERPTSVLHCYATTTEVVESAQQGTALPDPNRSVYGYINVAMERPADWRAAFCVSTGMVFLELCIDLMYLIMAFATAIAPWRFLGLVVVLFEKTSIWPARVRHKIMQMLDMSKSIHERFLDELGTLSEQTLKNKQFGLSLEKLHISADDSHIHWPVSIREMDRRGRPIDRTALANDLEALCSGGGVLYDRYVMLYEMLSDGLSSEVEKLQKRHPEETGDMRHPAKNTADIVNDFFRAHQEALHYQVMEYACSVEYRKHTIDRRVHDALLAKVQYFERDSHSHMNQVYDAVLHRREDIGAITGGCHVSCSAFFTRTTKEHRRIVKAMFQGACFDLVTIVFFFVNLALLYRAKPMLAALLRANVWEWKRIEVLRTAYDYLLDLVFLIESAIIVGSLYLSVDYLTEQANAETFHGAKKTAHRYMVTLAEDFLDVLGLLCSFKVLSYSFATAVFGFIVPGATISELLRSVIDSRFCRRLFSILVWVSFIIFPVLAINAVIPGMAVELRDVTLAPGLSLPGDGDSPVFTPDDIESISGMVGTYFALLFCVVVGSVVIAGRNSDYRTVYQPSTTVSATGPNALAILQLVFDAVQLAAVAWATFAFNQTPEEFQAQGTPNTTYGFLQDVSSSVLFFEEGTFMIVIGAMLTLVCLWYLLISGPIVVEDLFEWQAKGSITASPGWKFLIGFLGQNLYLTIVFNLFKVLQCKYQTVTPDGAEQEYRLGVLHGRASTVCWDGQTAHPALATLSLVLVAFYLFTAHVFTSRSGIAAATDDRSNLDIRFPIIDILAVDTAKIILSGCILLFPNRPWAMLSIVLVGGVFLLLWTASYERMFLSPVCHVKWVVQLRLGIYVAVIWSAVASMVELRRREKDGDPDGPLDFDVGLMFLIGAAVIFGLTWMFIMYSRAQAQKEHDLLMADSDVEGHIRELVRIEASMFERGAMLPEWDEKKRAEWIKTFSNAQQPRVIATSALELERHIHVMALSREFLDLRVLWVLGLMNPGLTAMDRLVDNLPAGMGREEKPAESENAAMYVSEHETEAVAQTVINVQAQRSLGDESSNQAVAVFRHASRPDSYTRFVPSKLSLQGVSWALQALIKSLRPVEVEAFDGMYEVGNVLDCIAPMHVTVHSTFYTCQSKIGAAAPAANELARELWAKGRLVSSGAASNKSEFVFERAPSVESSAVDADAGAGNLSFDYYDQQHPPLENARSVEIAHGNNGDGDGDGNGDGDGDDGVELIAIPLTPPPEPAGGNNDEL